MISDYEPIEDVKTLFAGRVRSGDTQLRIEATDDRTYLAPVWGEILLEGTIEQGTFSLRRIKRIALVGKTIQGFPGDALDPQTDPFNILSLVAPVGGQDEDQHQDMTSPVTPIRFQFHYQDLSRIGFERQLNTGNEYRDVVFPPVVQMNGTLFWSQLDITETTVRLQVNLFLEDDVQFNQNLDLKNLAATIQFESQIEVEFALVAAAPDASQVDNPNALPVLSAASLMLPCASPATPCPIDAPPLAVRRIALRFIDLSRPFGATPLIDLRDQQVSDACHVWRDQAILLLLVDPIIHNGTAQNVTYGAFNEQHWISLSSDPVLHMAGFVNIYIVDDVYDEFGIRLASGGLTLDAHVASVGIFLERSKLGSNTYLLAHELGHALGLGHPNEHTILNNGTELPAGAIDSVLHPPAFGQGNNAYQNCLIFGNPLLNPLALVAIPNVQDCLRLP